MLVDRYDIFSGKQDQLPVRPHLDGKKSAAMGITSTAFPEYKNEKLKINRLANHLEGVGKLIACAV